MYNKKRCRSKSIDDRRNLRWENKLIELKTILSELRFTIATAKSRNRWKCRVAAHTSPTTPTYAHHLFTDCNVGDIFQTGKNKSKRLKIFFFFGKQFWDLTQKKKKTNWKYTNKVARTKTMDYTFPDFLDVSVQIPRVITTILHTTIFLRTRRSRIYIWTFYVLSYSLISGAEENRSKDWRPVTDDGTHPYVQCVCEQSNIVSILRTSDNDVTASEAVVGVLYYTRVRAYTYYIHEPYIHIIAVVVRFQFCLVYRS